MCSFCTFQPRQTLRAITHDCILRSKKKELVQKIWQRIQGGSSASVTPDRDEPELAIVHHAGLCRAEMFVKYIT